jgi:hypothetical protein
MSVLHQAAIVAQELLGTWIEGLSRMQCDLGANDNPLAIYQLAATIFPESFTTNGERAA